MLASFVRYAIFTMYFVLCKFFLECLPSVTEGVQSKLLVFLLRDVVPSSVNECGSWCVPDSELEVGDGDRFLPPTVVPP